MRRALRTAIVVLAMSLLAACMGESAEQLMKTAEFEELQHNEEHSRQLYERIVREFPESPQAKVANERLAKPAPAE